MRTAITRRRPRSGERTYALPASLNVVRAPRSAIAVPIPRQRLLQGRAHRWALARTHSDGPDTLTFWLSGAASDGGSQEAFADSLGGYRSSTEADRVGRMITNLPSEIDLLQASRDNGVGGSGSIMVVDRNRLRYAAPDGSPGPAATLMDGSTAVLVDGSDPSKWVRVQRTGSSGIYGSGVVEFVEQRNNLFAMADADDAEHTAGSDKYRLVFLKSVHVAQNIKLWIRPLGSSAVSSGGVLGSSGSGTITTNTANAFAAWPWKGWAWISNAGTLREIVYYSSRTATTLTVPSLGRARLGTSAAAGNVADVVWPVPPYRIAWEIASPAAGGSVQTIADEDTAPTGVTWSTAITAATGISIGSLAAGEQGGLWLHRELPAGVSASPIHDCRLGVQFDVLTTTYAETLAGLFRIADDSLDRYELRLGTNAPPALSNAPVATSPTLPITYSGLAVDGTEYHVAIDRRNAWDVVAQSIQATVIRTTADGGVRPAPAAPYSITWRPGAGGVFTLSAFYSRYSDQIYDATATPPRWIDNADAWLIYARYDGTDPDPDTDTPTVVAMTQVDNIESLAWTSAAKTAGTVGKVIVRTRRSASVSGEGDDVDSTNVDVYSATAATAGPTGNRLRGFQRRNAEIL